MLVAASGSRAWAQPTPWQPIAYQITAHFDWQRRRLSATATVRLQAAHPVSIVPVELNPGLQLESVRLSGQPLAVSVSRHPGSTRLLVRLPQPPSGECSITFSYSGSLRLPRNGADYWTDTGALLTDDARWYPTVDPRAFTLNDFQLYVPAGFAAYTGGTLVARTSSAAAAFFHWQDTVAVSSRSLVIVPVAAELCWPDSAVGHLRTCFVGHAEHRQALQLLETVQKILRSFQRRLGPPLPEELRIVEGFPHTSGLAGYSSPGMLVMSEEATANLSDSWQPEFLPHELAHQWFPATVEMASNADAWLAESLAEYLAERYLESTDPVAAQRLVWRAERDALALSPLPPLRLGLDLLDLSDWDTVYKTLYQRGMLVWRTLEAIIGQPQLDSVLREYCHRYRGQQASLGNFQAVAESVAATSLDPFFRYFLDGTEVPRFRLRLHWDRKRHATIVTLRIEHFPRGLRLPVELVAGPDPIRQRLPIEAAETVVSLSSSQPLRWVQVDPDLHLLRWTPAAERNRLQRLLLIQADWMERSGELAQAVHLYQQALAADPHDEARNRQSLLFHLGRLSLRRGRPQQAQRWLQQSLQSDSEDPVRTELLRTWAHLLLARSALLDRHWLVAEQELRAAAQSSPRVLHQQISWETSLGRSAGVVMARLQSCLQRHSTCSK